MQPEPSKPKVLLLVEACNPEWTSVPLVGFNLARAIARELSPNVTIATHPRNRDAILRSDLPQFANLIFPNNEYAARPLFQLAKLLRGGTSLGWTTNTALASLAYPFFEFEVQKWLKHLPTSHPGFDLLHRITPVSPTAPSPIAKWSRLPFILGPLNGGLPWPSQFPHLRKKEREFLVPLRHLYRLLPYEKATYRYAQAVIAGSKHTHSEIPPYFRGISTILPENAVDPDRFPIKEHWTPPANPSEFRFLYAGRLVPYKGLWLVLRAMASSPILRRCKLHVAGDGPELPNLQKLAAQLDISPQIVWLGQLTQSKLATEMHAAQCFVFPSLREFGGAVVLEAMACGLPCIIADYGGPAELLDSSCGILIPLAPEEQFVPSLRQAMESLVQSAEKCQTFAANAARKVRSQFTWQAKAEKIIQIYQQVISKK